jgi:poly-gamma-glutamate capsule biosynthesis protein CapA/YwtB (metallophosphatase superfamily)
MSIVAGGGSLQPFWRLARAGIAIVLLSASLYGCTTTAIELQPSSQPVVAVLPTSTPAPTSSPSARAQPTAPPADLPPTQPLPSATPEPTPTSPAQPNVKGGDPTDSNSVRLMAVGDLMLGWEVGRAIVRQGPLAPWAGVKPFFDDADLVVANLECVISTQGSAWPSKLIHLRAPLAAAESLAAGGVDVVTVANNHALDFGAAAFGDTLNNLDAHGITHAGGGADRAAAHAPAIVERNGLTIAFLGYVLPFSSKTTFNTREWEATATQAGLAIGTPDVVAADVAAAREQADIVVVMVHGGVEHSSKPIVKQRAFARAALGAGASLVLGAHPHVLQGYVRGQDSLVAFSLGNFAFSRFDGAANDSAILDVTITPDGVTSLDWIPVLIDKRGIPRPATGPDAQRIMKRLPSLSL